MVPLLFRCALRHRDHFLSRPMWVGRILWYFVTLGLLSLCFLITPSCPLPRVPLLDPTNMSRYNIMILCPPWCLTLCSLIIPLYPSPRVSFSVLTDMTQPNITIFYRPWSLVPLLFRCVLRNSYRFFSLTQRCMIPTNPKFCEDINSPINLSTKIYLIFLCNPKKD